MLLELPLFVCTFQINPMISEILSCLMLSLLHVVEVSDPHMNVLYKTTSSHPRYLSVLFHVILGKYTEIRYVRK